MCLSEKCWPAKKKNVGQSHCLVWVLSWGQNVRRINLWMVRLSCYGNECFWCPLNFKNRARFNLLLLRQHGAFLPLYNFFFVYFIVDNFSSCVYIFYVVGIFVLCPFQSFSTVHPLSGTNELFLITGVMQIANMQKNVLCLSPGWW